MIRNTDLLLKKIIVMSISTKTGDCSLLSYWFSHRKMDKHSFKKQNRSWMF